MNDSKKTSYYNTLIFTIVAGIISVLLLLTLMFKRLRQFLPFIITLEIGIFLIIAWCVTVIYLNEKDMEKKRNEATSIQFDKCPDYFVKTTEGDKLMCVNQYMYIDDKNNQYWMKIYPINESVTLPSNLNSGTNLDAFPLMSLEQDSTLKSYKEKCSPLFNPSRPLNSQGQDPYLHYDKLPWTTMRGKCASLYD